MLQMSSDQTKKRSLKNNLLIIECECGHEIFLVPDLKNLGKAIEDHVIEHQKKHALTQKEANAIQDNLIAQALKIASKITHSSADIQVRLKPKKHKNKNNKNPEAGN
jgi:hypothetical protein